jgi:hypothetical protein
VTTTCVVVLCFNTDVTTPCVAVVCDNNLCGGVMC